MDDLEYEKIFTFNKESKKYKIKLTDAIKFLLSKQRFLEAKHHFLELEKINKNHILVMMLGFDIGVKTFDKTMVVKYDGMLDACKTYPRQDLYFKRLTYWLSVNNMKNAEASINILLNELNLDNDGLLILYNIVNNEAGIEHLIINVDKVLKQRKLMISKVKQS